MIQYIFWSKGMTKAFAEEIQAIGQMDFGLDFFVSEKVLLNPILAKARIPLESC